MIQDLLNKIQGSDGNPQGREGGADWQRTRNLVSNVASLAGLVALQFTHNGGIVERLPDPEETSLLGSFSNPLHSAERYEKMNEDGMNGITGVLRKKAEMSKKVAAGTASRENDNKYIKRFYDEKTILPNNIFHARFIPPKVNTGYGEIKTYNSPFRSPVYTKTGEDGNSTINVNPPAMIQPHHIKSVGFKVLPSNIGVGKILFVPFPEIDINTVDYEFSVEFEEDTVGTVFNFLQWCYHRVVDMGFYHYTTNNRIGSFEIVVYNAAYLTIQKFLFTEVFLKDAGDINLTYEGSSPRTYRATFHATNRVAQTFSLDEATEMAMKNEDIDDIKNSNTIYTLSSNT